MIVKILSAAGEIIGTRLAVHGIELLHALHIIRHAELNLLNLARGRICRAAVLRMNHCADDADICCCDGCCDGRSADRPAADVLPDSAALRGFRVGSRARGKLLCLHHDPCLELRIRLHSLCDLAVFLNFHSRSTPLRVSSSASSSPGRAASVRQSRSFRSFRRSPRRNIPRNNKDV